MPTSISIKPKQVTKRLLVVLPERARNVVTNRYGLGGSPSRMTLEAIGTLYGITRERVRQIENHALLTIRKSDAFAKETGAFRELRDYMENLGGIITEDDLLKEISDDASTQNHIYLLLVLGDEFTKRKEDAEFKHRWYSDEKKAEIIHQVLRKIYKNLSEDDLIQESEMIVSFLNQLKGIDENKKTEAIAKRWLGLSKKIGRNSLGEWGIVTSPNIRVKGMRDLAYLSIRRHGSPMHFTEVARAITQLFGKKAHVATCHNELIKDDRFVLVGRGLYALAEWGYAGGVVRDVIREILKKHGPLTRKEIIDKVLKERYVKENTVVVNLENESYFKKDRSGKYSVV